MNISENNNKKVIIYIAIAAIFYGTSIGINISTFSLILDQLAFSKSKIGQILSFEMLSALLLSPFIPILMKKFGIFRILFIGLIMRNIFLILFGFAHTEFMWKICIFIFGAGGLFLIISWQIWINKITTNDNRATNFGILNSALALGIAFGPFLTNLLEFEGINSLYLSAISCLLILPVLYLIKDDTPQIVPSIIMPFSEIIKKAKIPILSGLVVDYIFFSLSTYIILYGMSNGLKLHESKALISYMVISKIFFDIPIGIVIDKLNRNVVIFACAFAALISVQILQYAIQNQYQTIFLFTFWSASVSGIYIAAISKLGDNFKGSNLITANSSLFIMNSLGAYTGIYATGYAIEYFGDQGLVISISAVITMFMLLNIFSLISNKFVE